MKITAVITKEEIEKWITENLAARGLKIVEGTLAPKISSE